MCKDRRLLNVVVLDQGMAKTMSTTTQFEKVYAIIFDQSGLKAGMGLQGFEDFGIHSVPTPTSGAAARETGKGMLPDEQ
jgi:hypothetical protein